MLCYFDNCICHQNWNIFLKDDARLIPCDSHLRAMQQIRSTATIGIYPYKDPCKNGFVTLTTLWLTFGIRDMYWKYKTPARQLAQITSLTILGTCKVTTTALSWKFHALMATGYFLTRLVVTICRIMVPIFVLNICFSRLWLYNLDQLPLKLLYAINF